MFILHFSSSAVTPPVLSLPFTPGAAGPALPSPPCCLARGHPQQQQPQCCPFLTLHRWLSTRGNKLKSLQPAPRHSLASPGQPLAATLLPIVVLPKFCISGSLQLPRRSLISQQSDCHSKSHAPVSFLPSQPHCFAWFHESESRLHPGHKNAP